MKQCGAALCSPLREDATAWRHRCILWVCCEWDSGFSKSHCYSFQVCLVMATGKIHRSMGSSKMADGLQSKVAVRRYPKLVREAEQRVPVSTCWGLGRSWVKAGSCPCPSSAFPPVVRALWSQAPPPHLFAAVLLLEGAVMVQWGVDCVASGKVQGLA